jgi:hypothetical protein
MRHNRTTFSTALAAMIALAIAGCGSAGGPGGGATSGARDTSPLLSFARCMRAHRVSGFPDPGGEKPSGSGVSIFGIAVPATVDIHSPAFQAAMGACQTLATGGAPHAGLTQAEKEAALRFSQCMRAHGVPSYPDPVFRNGRIGVTPGAGNDPNSPAFLAAQTACGSP